MICCPNIRSIFAKRTKNAPSGQWHCRSVLILFQIWQMHTIGIDSFNIIDVDFHIQLLKSF